MITPPWRRKADWQHLGTLTLSLIFTFGESWTSSLSSITAASFKAFPNTFFHEDPVGKWIFEICTRWTSSDCLKLEESWNACFYTTVWSFGIDTSFKPLKMCYYRYLYKAEKLNLPDGPTGTGTDQIDLFIVHSETSTDLPTLGKW